MTTKRQEFWAAAAEEDAHRNPIAATLFALLAQPNPAEKRAKKKKEDNDHH